MATLGENIGESLRKVFLVGLGAAATTAEKSKSVIDSMVKKGEITLEQGKALNEELKRNMDEKRKNTSVRNDIVSALDNMTPEELAELKEKLKDKLNDQSENDDDDKPESGDGSGE